MFTDSDIQIDGDTLTIDIWSSTLPVVHIDTYVTFAGESWADQEYEYLIDEENADPESIEIDYDMEAIRKALAEASIDYVLETVDREVILNVELSATFAPREYNFTTDAYDARFTVCLSKLQAWAAESKFDVDAYVEEFHQSYDGFISFVPSALESNREAMTHYLMIAAYLRSVLDSSEHDMHVWESESEAYSNNTTTTWKPKA